MALRTLCGCRRLNLVGPFPDLGQWSNLCLHERNNLSHETLNGFHYPKVWQRAGRLKSAHVSQFQHLDTLNELVRDLLRRANQGVSDNFL